MFSKYKGKCIQFLKAIIAVVIIFFIFRYVKSNVNAINNFEFHLDYYYLSISFIILIIFIFNQFVLWYYLTRQNHCSISFSNSITSRAYSEFGKYVPGKILGYAMLFYAYSKKNQSKTLVAFCMFLESLASVLATALIFLFSIFFTDIHEFQKYRIIAFILLAFFFVLIHPKFLNYFSAIFHKLAKREPVLLQVSYTQILKLIFLYLANFMIFGIAFIIFINSIYPLSFSNYLFITGTTLGASLIGLFAIFVPAGLGVREGVMVLTLSFIVPPAIAGIIALTSRLWITSAELFLVGLIFGFSKLKLHKLFKHFRQSIIENLKS